MGEVITGVTRHRANEPHYIKGASIGPEFKWPPDYSQIHQRAFHRQDGVCLEYPASGP